MRLLNTQTIKLEEFTPDKIPPYIILSHTWEDDEVTFSDIQGSSADSKAGYSKLKGCCRDAQMHGFRYVWVDTCCIDKSSSAELSEAINSMFRWYKEAKICVAYLSDVPPGRLDDKSSERHAQIRASRWFTRAWTLQELLAPSLVLFYSIDWDLIGTRGSLIEPISEATGIDKDFLGGLDIGIASIAQRMSWAATRNATREEDLAYSLLGIFGINMPLIYGEGGANAFLRLQEELIKRYHDQSLFAWHDDLDSDTPEDSPIYGGVLAISPYSFRGCQDVVKGDYGYMSQGFAMTNTGIQLDLPVEGKVNAKTGKIFHAILACHRKHHFSAMISIPLRMRGNVCYRTGKGAKETPWTRRGLLTPRNKMPLTLSPRPLLDEKRFLVGNFFIRSLPQGYSVSGALPQDCWRKAISSVDSGLNASSLRNMHYSGPQISRRVLLKYSTDSLAFIVSLSIQSGSCESLAFRGRIRAVRADEPAIDIFKFSFIDLDKPAAEVAKKMRAIFRVSRETYFDSHILAVDVIPTNLHLRVGGIQLLDDIRYAGQIISPALARALRLIPEVVLIYIPVYVLVCYHLFAGAALGFVIVLAFLFFSLSDIYTAATWSKKARIFGAVVCIFSIALALALEGKVKDIVYSILLLHR
jgi:hypothetical protein